MVNLSNVDNTSDLTKPISTATQTALNLKAPINNPTFTGTISVGGTLLCPQLKPISLQSGFNTIKAPRLYQYDLFIVAQYLTPQTTP